MGKKEELAEKIKRFHSVNERRKLLEKEEEALRDWFKAEAKGQEIVFQWNDIEVPVTLESRTSLDSKALRVAYGDKIKRFEKKSTYWKVSVRKVPGEVLKAG